MSFYLGKDRRDPSKALLHITRDTRQNINDINAGFDGDSVFHSDLPYLRIIDTFDLVPFNSIKVSDIDIFFHEVFAHISDDLSTYIRSNHKFILSYVDGTTNTEVFYNQAYQVDSFIAESLSGGFDAGSYNLQSDPYIGALTGFNVISNLIGEHYVDEEQFPDGHLMINSIASKITLPFSSGVISCSPPFSSDSNEIIIRVRVLNLAYDLIPDEALSVGDIRVSPDTFNIGSRNMLDYSYLSADSTHRTSPYTPATLGAIPTTPYTTQTSGTYNYEGSPWRLSLATKSLDTSQIDMDSFLFDFGYSILNEYIPDRTGTWDISNDGISRGQNLWALGREESFIFGSFTDTKFFDFTFTNETRSFERFLFEIPEEATLGLLCFVDDTRKDLLGNPLECNLPIIIGNLKQDQRIILSTAQGLETDSFGEQYFIRIEGSKVYLSVARGSSGRFAFDSRFRAGLKMYYLR